MFDQKVTIRKVKAVAPKKENTSIFKVQFFDEASQKCAEYNPKDYTNEIKEINIAQNEELIGVYGACLGRSFFKSFGFIVKVKEPL